MEFSQPQMYPNQESLANIYPGGDTMLYSNVPADPNLYPAEPEMYPDAQAMYPNVQQPMYNNPEIQPGGYQAVQPAIYPDMQSGGYPEVQLSDGFPGAQPMYPEVQPGGGYPGAQPMYPEVQPGGGYPGAQPMYPEVQPGVNRDEWYVPPGSIPQGFELSNSDDQDRDTEIENSNLVPLAQPPPKNDWNSYSKSFVF